MWRERLAQAGFRLEVDEDSLAGTDNGSREVQAVLHEDHVGLDYQGQTGPSLRPRWPAGSGRCGRPC